MKNIFRFLLLLSLPFVLLRAQDNSTSSPVEKYLPKLDRIIQLHGIVKDMHPVLSNLYPVAIVENGQFLIFEPVNNSAYKFVKQKKVESFVPAGIKAAYPLQENDNKMTCVVTGEVFNSFDGYAIIFHEFVHCAQFATVELKLKENLDIYKTAMKSQDWMWELNYPFPYAKKEFEENFSALLSEMNKNNIDVMGEIKKKLRQHLTKEEYSYMTWVEWKEGFARWIENKVRNKFRISENHSRRIPPYDRSSFYESGSQKIELIYKSDPPAINDLSKLYNIITQ